jgi:hypothetical protein
LLTRATYQIAVAVTISEYTADLPELASSAVVAELTSGIILRVYEKNIRT